MKQIKKIIALVLCAALLATGAFSVTAEQNTVWQQGDVNEDGNVNASDALDVLKSVVGKIQFTNEQQIRGDVNLDDKVNAADALNILQYVVGKLPGLPQRDPDPLDEPLTDTSIGEINPRLAPSVYNKEVMVADIIPSEDGYVVWGDGVTDCTDGIQKALNDCANAGGGTVYLPSGKYLVTKPLTIPARVTLLGDWQDPDLGTNLYGTVIFANVPSVDTNQDGLFLLGGSAGVIGLTIYYPEQSLENVKPYPPVFYTNGQGGSYMLSTVKNCTVINGYRGIGACCHTVNPNAHEQLTVENFKGTFLNNAAEVYNQADVGTWENVTVSDRYWAKVNGKGMTAADEAQLRAYTKANTIGMKLGDLEWTEFMNLTIENCKIGLEIEKGQRIQFAGSLYNVAINNCTTGISVLDLDPRWGMLIAQSTIDGGIDNKTDGLVKMMNVTVNGTCKGAVTNEQHKEVATLSITKGSYKNPARNLTVANLSKDGTSDVSQALQQLLNDMATTGGIVYLPAGAYRLDGPVQVPANVQLRGCSSVATRGFAGNGAGTVILAYYGDGEQFDAETDTALITLAGENAGIYGIRITYPRNGSNDIDFNTTYTIRGKAKGVYAVNCCITASGYGIDFRGCDNHYINKVTTCCYYNTFLLGGKNGVLSGCLQNGTVLTRCSDPLIENWFDEQEQDIFFELFDTYLRRLSMYIITDHAQNQTIYNTFAYGCHTMITMRETDRAKIANIGCDNIGGYQMHLQSGNATAINTMRYNGISYRSEPGTLGLYNRLTINDKSELNGVF